MESSERLLITSSAFIEHRNIRRWVNDPGPKMARQRNNNQKKNRGGENGSGECSPSLHFENTVLNACKSSYLTSFVA